jgi:hypothetical protein
VNAICGVTADKYGNISKFSHFIPSFAWTGRLHMQSKKPVLGDARIIPKIFTAVMVVL